MSRVKNDFSEKAEEAYKNQNYEEALKYAIESLKEEKNEKTEKLIKKCNIKIEDKNTQINYQILKELDQECLYVLNKNNYYDILELNKFSTSEDVKKSYKKLAKKFHPDKNLSIHSQEAFKSISNAFTNLNDIDKRKKYDLNELKEEDKENRKKSQSEREKSSKMNPNVKRV